MAAFGNPVASPVGINRTFTEPDGKSSVLKKQACRFARAGFLFSRSTTRKAARRRLFAWSGRLYRVRTAPAAGLGRGLWKRLHGRGLRGGVLPGAPSHDLTGFERPSAAQETGGHKGRPLVSVKEQVRSTSAGDGTPSRSHPRPRAPAWPARASVGCYRMPPRSGRCCTPSRRSGFGSRPGRPCRWSHRSC